MAITLHPPSTPVNPPPTDVWSDAHATALMAAGYPTVTMFGCTSLAPLEPGIGVCVTAYQMTPNGYPYSPALMAMIASGVPDLTALLHMGWDLLNANVLYRAIASRKYQ